MVGCELIPRIALDFTLRQAPDIQDPLSAAHEWYVLMKAAAGREDSGLRETLEQMLAEAFEAGLVVDATDNRRWAAVIVAVAAAAALCCFGLLARR